MIEKVNSIAAVLHPFLRAADHLDQFLILRTLLLLADSVAEKADRDTRELGVRDKPSATAVSVAAVP